MARQVASSKQRPLLSTRGWVEAQPEVAKGNSKRG